MFTNMAEQTTPQSVRIRTDDGNEWRYDAIQQAASLYECNRSDAVAYACEDVVRLVEAAESILDREDLTVQQRAEIASTFDRCLSDISVSIETAVSIESD